MGLCPDVRVLTHQQPAHVSKEKAPFCIVWICIRLRKLVMHTMITGPFKDIILEYRDFTTQNETLHLLGLGCHHTQSTNTASTAAVCFERVALLRKGTTAYHQHPEQDLSYIQYNI